MPWIKNRTAIQYRSQGSYLAGIILLLILTLYAFKVPLFFESENLGNLSRQLVPLLIASLGQMVVLAGAGFDLSTGAMISLTSAILVSGLPVEMAIPAAILAGMAVGCLNGMGILGCQVHPVVMTLASMSIVQGLTLILLPTPGGQADSFLVLLVSSNILGMPMSLFWIGLAILGSWFLTRWHSFGIHVVAVGQDEQAAHKNGLPVRRIRVLTYVYCSLAATLAGIYLTGRLESGDPLLGKTLGLDSILGAVLGGVLLSGGFGSVWGVVAGVAIIGIANNGMNLMGVSPFYQFVIKGLLLIVSASLFRRQQPGL